MNGVQLTFFNFSGYLIPGFVLSLLLLPALAVYPLVGSSFVGLIDSDLLKTFGLVGAPLVAAAFLPVLAIVFLLGVILSETSMWIVTLLFIKDWSTENIQTDSLYSELTKEGRSRAFLERYPVREMASLRSSGGWDLYGAVGIARLLTASGAAFLLSAFVYTFASWQATIVLTTIGFYLAFVGCSLSKYNNKMCEILAFLEEHPPTLDAVSNVRRNDP